ncbi:MAG: hypothetical protein JSV69_04895 [Chloroflexota bacterium]|nr:MAG: hypothetical protein JSV69_04895 [Chloroflexota bacterium]
MRRLKLSTPENNFFEAAQQWFFCALLLLSIDIQGSFVAMLLSNLQQVASDLGITQR